MDTTVPVAWFETAKATAYEAGKVIMEVYNSADLGIQQKTDHSPLTFADKAAHDVIEQGLETTGLPVLSEEGKSIPFSLRNAWTYYWLVDPLDGTKEFIKGSGEFTVNIALIHKGAPIFGVVYVPVKNTMYWGGSVFGSFKQVDAKQPVKLPLHRNHAITAIVASRFHMSTETQRFIEKYPGVKLISMGSSLKFLLVAEGNAQLYPRFASTMEWDSAAAQAVVEGAGGKVVKYPDGQALTYNKANLLNPWFLVQSA